LSVGNGLTASGSLDPDWFVKGSHATATQAHGQFVYDTSTHTLMWDSDGTGAGAAEALASLNLNISSSDLLVL